VDDVVDDCSDHNIAGLKLQWWRDTMAQTFAGEPQHPVQKALLPVIKNHQLPLELFLEIIDGMEMDLTKHRYADFKDLSLYCYRVASAVGLLTIEILGYQNRTVQKYAYHLGLAFQLTNILRDVREDAELGRIYIPLEDLHHRNISETDVLSLHSSAALLEVFKLQARRAREHYEKAFKCLPEEDRYSQLCGIIMAAIYTKTLEQIEKSRFNVLQGRISLSPINKLWITWKTVRAEKKRRKKFVTSTGRTARKAAS
jgi:phytoene synthase